MARPTIFLAQLLEDYGTGQFIASARTRWETIRNWDAGESVGASYVADFVRLAPPRGGKADYLFAWRLLESGDDPDRVGEEFEARLRALRKERKQDGRG